MSICELSEISLTHAQLCLSSGMSASQDNLLNQKVNEAQGDILLDQSVHLGEDSSDDVIVEYERIIGPPESPKFGCEECDLFEDDSITNSQLLCYAEAPTQEEIPEVPAKSPEDEVVPPTEAMEGIELQQSAPLRDSQDIIGQGDLEDSPPFEQELPLGEGDSKEMEFGPQLEHKFLRGSETYHWSQSNRVVWTVVCPLTNGPYLILC